MVYAVRCAIILTLLCVATAGAQNSGRIEGTVIDRETGKPLTGVTILVEGSGSGVTSDDAGRFVITQIPEGTWTIRSSRVGYRPWTTRLTIALDSTVQLSVRLAPVLIEAGPVTVTATRGRERETPATFATLAAEDIRSRYTTQDIPVLLSELPSTTFYSEGGNGMGYTYLNIRGFDARRVAVMVNGIPQNDPEDHNVYWLDMPDIAASVEDIQVQRGAGSAFYGPPAIGGSVNVVTRSLDGDRAVTLSAGVGSNNTRRYEASVSSGRIDDRYAIHARLSRLLSSGYRDRAWVDFSSYFLGVVRFDENMTTQFNFYGGPVADGLAYYGIAKSDVTDRSLRRANPIQRPEEIENFSQPHYELLHQWRIGPTVTLNNSLFLVTGDGFFDYDGSWAPASYFRIGPQFGIPVTGDPEDLYFPGALIRAQVTNKQAGWLPRLTWTYDGGVLIAGAELRVHRSEHWGRLQWGGELPAGVPFDYRYYSYKGAKDIGGAYAHVLHALSPSMTLMADLQYSFNRYRLFDEKIIGTDFSVPYHFVNPRIGLNVNLDEQWNTYVSVAYTTREPRLKNLYDAAEASTPASWGAVLPQFAPDGKGGYDFSRPLVKPESLLDFELGSGYTTPALRLTANFYWMEFTDEIVKSGQVDRFGQPVTGNAARTRHAGIELSGRASVGDYVDIAANATFSRNRFVTHTDYQNGTPTSLDGNPIAGFPDVLANARITFRLDQASVSMATKYVGKQYTDNTRREDHTVDPYVVTDLSASVLLPPLGDVRAELRLQVNNIFDVLYAAYGEGDQFFVGAERTVFASIALHL